MMYLAAHKESLSQKSSFSEEKYDNLLLQLHIFREIKYSNDAFKIINYIHQITNAICEVCSYKDKNYIDNQLKMIFSDCL